MLRIPGKRARPSVITLADRARDARQWDVAARYYRVALNRRPNNPPIWVQYGHVLKESGRLTEAENAYRSALAYDWGVADTHLHLADVLRIQGKKDDAQASYLRAFSLDPSMPHPLHELGALGWSQVHLSELRRFAALDGSRPVAPPPEGLAIPSTGTRYASISQEGHWLESWHGRWRNAFRATQTFAEAIYLSCNPDVQEQMRKGAFRSGGEHWVRCGLIEDLLGTRSRVPGYCEGSYLYHNPDVASQVTDNIYPSGYHHFLTYGYSEGRVGWSFPNQLAVPTYDFPSLQARLESLAERPLISIIVPVYETDTQMLEWCIESVRRQIYPNWQLCIADDGSTRPDVRDILLTYGRLDERINTIFLDENRGISAASNAALALTSGLWVALLDHDDELTPDALLEIASTIVADPHVDVIYSDEDKISAKGDIYYDPVFKPDWSPDLLKSTMYVGHLTVHRKALISQVGGFHTEFDGTQDYDLALRVTEVAKRVHHIPKTLYHWRASPKSAAFDIANKGYAVERQKMALEAALLRAHTAGSVTPASSPGTWRVCYAPPTPHPMVSIVIPTAGYTRTICGRCFNLLQNCIQSLTASGCYDNFEIIVIDNDDLDSEVGAWLDEIPEVHRLHFNAERFNICEKINLGVASAKGEYILLLNDDTEVISPGFLFDMVGLASQPGVGAVSAQLLFPDARVQHNGVLITVGGPTHMLLGEHASTPGPLNIGRLVHNAIAVTGACLLVKRDLFRAVGGLDPGLPMNYNDVDFCLKLHERGMRIVIDPGVKLYHFESASKLGTYSWELQNFFQRWPELDDPYFNRNYRQDRVYFEPRLLHEPKVADFSSCFQRWFKKRRVEVTKEKVRFSVIFSVYNTPAKFLEELEASLFNQSYQNFECVVIENGSTNTETLQWFKRISRDPRVHSLRFEQNVGIMRAYGAAFVAATGEYVVPVDSDDFLTLDALAILAHAIIAHNRPAALYSDECKSNADSLLLHPFHKPDWDPVLFTNICYTCHLGCFRRDLAIAAGCYEDTKASWCHDWDTNWRLFRAGEDPVHVPEITYAWRMYAGSTSSLEHSNKPEAPESQKHVLTQQMQQSVWGKSLEIVENELFAHKGMWRLRPKSDIRIEGCVVVDMQRRAASGATSIVSDIVKTSQGVRLILVSGEGDDNIDRTARIASRVAKSCLISVTSAIDVRRALDSAANGPGEFVVWIGRDTVPRGDGWFIETVGLLQGIGDAVLGAGRVATLENRLLWAGGFFGINGFLDSPDLGRVLDDSGYHGMVHCQRSVDGVPSVHWVAQGRFLRQVIERLPMHLSPATLATALALRANAECKRVLYTPLNLMITGATTVRPAVPDAELERVLGTTAPRTSRYYSRQLCQRSGFHWVPTYQLYDPRLSPDGAVV